jgi:hypothetical protein
MGKLKAIAGYAVSALGILVACELLVRAYDWRNPLNPLLPNPMPEWVHMDPSGIMNVDGLSDVPGHFDTIVAEQKYFPYYLRTDSNGFRNTRDYDPSQPTILAVGGSATFGSLVNNQDTYPQLLQSMLDRRAGGPAPIQVMNAGVRGYHPRSAMEYLREKGLALRPKVVLLQLSSGALVDSFPEPGTADPDRATGRRLAVERKTFQLRAFLGEHVALYNLAGRLKRARLREQILEQAAEKRAAAAAGGDLAMRRILYEPDSPESRPHWQKLGERLKALDAEVAAAGGRLVLVLLPDDEEIIDPTYPDTPRRAFHRLCQSLNIALADPLPIMARLGGLEAITMTWHPRSDQDYLVRRIAADYPKPIDYRIAGDPHYSRIGNWALARAVLDELDRIGLEGIHLSPR